MTQSSYQTQEELSVPSEHLKKLRNIGSFKTSPAHRASCLLQSCPCSLIELSQYYSLSLFNIVKYSWTVHCHVQLLFANFITVKLSKTLICQFYHSRSLGLFQMERALEKTNYETLKWRLNDCSRTENIRNTHFIHHIINILLSLLQGQLYHCRITNYCINYRSLDSKDVCMELLIMSLIIIHRPVRRLDRLIKLHTRKRIHLCVQQCLFTYCLHFNINE